MPCTTVVRMRKTVPAVLAAVVALTAASCSSSGTPRAGAKTATASRLAGGQDRGPDPDAATAAAKKSGSAHYVLTRRRRQLVADDQW